jgi:hypothetical protein
MVFCIGVIEQSRDDEVGLGRWQSRVSDRMNETVGSADLPFDGSDLALEDSGKIMVTSFGGNIRWP